MSGIESWSTTPANNNQSPPFGWPAGILPSQVEPIGRQMMTSLAAWYQAAEWINYNFTPTYVNATQFTLPGNVTPTFHVNRRVQATDGSTSVYGTITVSAFTTLTTVTVVWDSGVLQTGVTIVYVGITSSVNTSAPNPTSFSIRPTFNAGTLVKGDAQGYALQNSAGSGYGIIESVLGYTGAGSNTDLAIANGGANINFYAGAAGAAGRTAVSILNNTAVNFGNSTDNQAFNFQGSGLLKAGDQGGVAQDIGWRDAPQNLQNANYTFALSDRGKDVHHTSGVAHTWTIPDNSVIAFPVGTVIILTNSGAAAVTIGIPATDSLVWVPSGLTTARTLTGFGQAQLLKVAATTWFLTGANLT